MRRPLTVKQAVEVLGLHPQTLYKWTKLGRIPYMRIGGGLRFDPAILADWLEQRTIS